MKQDLDRKLKKVMFYALYVPCVLLDAICKDAADVFSKIKSVLKDLTASAKVIFANRKVLIKSVKADMIDVISHISDVRLHGKKHLANRKTRAKSPLSKKMFASTATMVVSAILLIAVSYGQYRIMIPGEIRMPQAAEFNQSGFLYPTIDNYDGKVNEGDSLPEDKITGSTYDDKSLLYDFRYADTAHYGQTYASEVIDADKDKKTDLVYDMYLNDLQPGDDVRDIVKRYKELPTEERQTDKYLLTHSFHLELQNRDKNGKANQIPSHYTISISSIGSIKLEMILVDNAKPNEYYYGVKSGNTYTFRKITDDSVVATAGSDIDCAGEDAVFDFESLTEQNAKNADINDWNNEKRDYTIFIGWDNSYENTSLKNTLTTTQANTNAKSRKEVEVLNIKVTSTGESIGSYPDGIIYDGQWISDQIVTESMIQEILRAKTKDTPRAQAAADQNTAYTDDEKYPGEVLVKSGEAAVQ